MMNTAEPARPVLSAANSAEAIDLGDLGRRARVAARATAAAEAPAKNEALGMIADAVDRGRAELLQVNAEDVARAREVELTPALIDRLVLDDRRIDGLVNSLRLVQGLPDPVGAIRGLSTQPSGLRVGRMRVPLGVVGMIYESRPGVTADAAGLCLKAGNAVILRGGSEASGSNRLLASLIRSALAASELPEDGVQLIETTDRRAVDAMLALDDCIDLIIPRGGRGLIGHVSRSTKIPVLKHLDGICHLYIDRGADLELALAVADNAKTYRYGICGAMETLLVDAEIAASFLPRIAAVLREKGVGLRGCRRTCELLAADVEPASEEDWGTEYLAPVLSIAVVDGLDQAMAHIARYGSQHTDGIVTEDLNRAQRFLRGVDSSSVMVNAPTCWADGFEYGLGAEIGISTDKLHARGPVGVEGLTTEKFIVFGRGQLRG